MEGSCKQTSVSFNWFITIMLHLLIIIFGLFNATLSSQTWHIFFTLQFIHCYRANTANEHKNDSGLLGDYVVMVCLINRLQDS